MDWLSSVSSLKNQLSELDSWYRLYAAVNIQGSKLYNKAETKYQILCSNSVTELQSILTKEHCFLGQSARIEEGVEMRYVIYPIEFKYYICSVGIYIYYVNLGKCSIR